MGNISYSVIGVLVILIVLTHWWQPKTKMVRRGIGIALFVVVVLMIADGWIGRFKLPIDLNFTRQLNMAVITLFGVFVFGTAIRTFVTDYRRASAERRAREAS